MASGRDARQATPTVPTTLTTPAVSTTPSAVPATPTTLAPGAVPKERKSKQRTQAQGIQLLPLLIRSLKISGMLLLVWIVGYLGFSVTWVIIGLVFYVVADEYRKVKKSKTAYAKQAVVNEQEAILARVDELPSWVRLTK